MIIIAANKYTRPIRVFETEEQAKEFAISFVPENAKPEIQKVKYCFAGKDPQIGFSIFMFLNLKDTSKGWLSA